jgi:hypothetical protein
MNSKKEVAKFLAGAAAWEGLTHLILAFTDLLPLRIWGFTLTPVLNIIWIVFIGAVTITLAWYAWGSRRAS